MTATVRSELPLISEVCYGEVFAVFSDGERFTATSMALSF